MTPRAARQRARNKRQYEHGVSVISSLLNAGLKIYRNGQEMRWCLDDKTGRCMTVTFNMADGTHTAEETNDG